MVRFVVAPLAAAALVGCADGLSTHRTSPEAGATDVSLTSEVTFRLGRAFDATHAFVQWNHSGSNGRIPARLEVSGRRIVVTPQQVLPDGSLQNVSIHGLRTLSGVDIPAVHTQFRTVYEEPRSLFAWQDGSPTGEGYRCVTLPDGRLQQCLHYRAGMGKDGLPGTEDDLDYVQTFEYDGPLLVRTVYVYDAAVRAKAYTYNEREIEATVTEIDAGPDEQLDTEDDEVEMVEFSEFDDQGFRVAVWNGDVGEDGEAGTRDDVRSGGTRYLTDDLGQDLGFWQVAERDGEEVVFRTWEIDRDAAGQFRQGAFYEVGADGSAGTQDDELVLLRWAGLDEEGRISGLYDQNGDGTLSLWQELVFDASGRTERSIRRFPVDERWPENDESVDSYWECDLEEGRRRSCRTITEPGEDGAWLTEDDPPERTLEYAP
ncbi:MAG: Ig-like domain-containing protein [Myxococcales bacterium]|nr:Ig-like domain-containing protein [Myxococcales bacterium]